MSDAGASKEKELESKRPTNVQVVKRMPAPKQSIFMPKRTVPWHLKNRIETKGLEPILPYKNDSSELTVGPERLEEVRFKLRVALENPPAIQAAPSNKKRAVKRRREPEEELEEVGNKRRRVEPKSRHEPAAEEVVVNKRRKVEGSTKKASASTPIDKIWSQLQTEANLRRNIIEAPKERVLGKGVDYRIGERKTPIHYNVGCSTDRQEGQRLIAPLPTRSVTAHREVEKVASSSSDVRKIRNTSSR